jgi:aspartate/methionine/tyrosine aminotransferase
VFSRRLNWSEESNALSALLAAKRSYLDLTQSNPTKAGFEYPAISLPAALHYDPDPRGLESAREAVSRYYGGAMRPDQILLTASTSEAYSYIFKLLADPGDEVLVPRPSYPLFEFLARLESLNVRQYPLRYDGAWHIDFASLESLITDRTRAIVLVNPNNPTGSYLKRDELERLKAFRVPIVSDEVFSDYAFGRDDTRVERLVGTFSMSGLSKIAGLPQMKLGWIATRDEEALHRLELIADTYLSVATPVQLALPELLRNSVGDQIRARTAANLAWLRSQIQPLNVEGGWYATLQVPRVRSEEEWCLMLLRDHDVLVQPGFFFDFESEAYLVVSLLTEPAIFEEGIRRIASIV